MTNECILTRSSHDPADDPTPTEEQILYPESGYSLIQYGESPTTDEIIPSQFNEHQNLADIDAFIETATRHVTEQRRPRPTRDSLHGRNTRLLQVASSAVMITARPEHTQGTSTDETETTIPEDESQTQIPTQFLSPPQQLHDELNGDETQTLIPEDESQTQIPTQFLPPPQQLHDKVLTPESPTQIPTQFLQTASLPAPSTKKPRGRPKKKQVTSCTTEPVQTTLPVTVRSLPEFWCDCPGIYPDPVEIVGALQDPGKKHIKTVNGRRQQETTFPLIQKICTKIYQKIQALYSPEGLTKNTTRGRESLSNIVLMNWKLTDAMNLDVFFHKFAKNGQVYTITDDPVHCGLNVPLKEFQTSILDQIRRSRASRTCNDGLRLALTLLDPKYRESVAIIRSNRKERVHSDISGDYVLHLFEEILVQSFKNQGYRPPEPQSQHFGDIDEEGAQWNPNDPKIFEIDRNAVWLLETWKVYVKRKYKSALDRWNKETGGGNGQPWSFVNYCDKDARWLVVVFLADVESNYLLAANAGGRMPGHLQMECGFEGSPSFSSLENDSDPQSRVTAKKKAILEAQEETKELKADIRTVVAKLDHCLEAQQQAQQQANRTSDQVFDEVTKMNRALNDKESLQSMSPNTREKYTTSLQAKRKRYIDDMFEMEEKEKRSG